MESPLVIGIDGSPPSLDAVDWAVAEAALRGLPVRLVYASRWQRYEGAVPQDPTERPSEQELIDALVADAVQRARRRDADVRIATDVLAEDTVMSLVGESRHAAMVVIGSRGRGGLSELLLGSVSLGVAARAHCPVIVVRGDKAGREGTHGRVMLGVADAGEGAEATRFAFREAAERRSELEAVRAWRRPLREVLRETVGHPRPADDPGAYHAGEAAAQIETAVAEGVRDHPGLALRHSAVEGPPHKVLVQRSAAADLVVVGARRRQGHFGLQLGRVAHAVLHHGECPVAVVPEHDVPSTTAAAKEI